MEPQMRRPGLAWPRGFQACKDIVVLRHPTKLKATARCDLLTIPKGSLLYNRIRLVRRPLPATRTFDTMILCCKRTGTWVNNKLLSSPHATAKSEVLCNATYSLPRAQPTVRSTKSAQYSIKFIRNQVKKQTARARPHRLTVQKF